MKAAKIFFTLAVVSFLLCYFCGAFVKADFNFSHWSEDARLAVIMTWSMFLVCSLMAVSMTDNKF